MSSIPRSRASRGSARTAASQPLGRTDGRFAKPTALSAIVLLAIALLAIVAQTGCQAPGAYSSLTASRVASPEREAVLRLPATDDFQVLVPEKSWTDFKFKNTIRQKYDYSCGSAALATLLQYYFEDNIREQDVLKIILVRIARSPNPQAEMADRFKNGLSLLDLWDAAKDLGYGTTGVYEIPFDKLKKLHVPVIVRIEKFGYKHFVVFRGVVEDRVFLADSIRGNVRLSEDEFLKQWSGHSLVVGKDANDPMKDFPLELDIEGSPCVECEVARQAILHAP